MGIARPYMWPIPVERVLADLLLFPPYNTIPHPPPPHILVDVWGTVVAGDGGAGTVNVYASLGVGVG